MRVWFGRLGTIADGGLPEVFGNVLVSSTYSILHHLVQNSQNCVAWFRESVVHSMELSERGTMDRVRGHSQLCSSLSEAVMERVSGTRVSIRPSFSGVLFPVNELQPDSLTVIWGRRHSARTGGSQRRQEARLLNRKW